MIDGFLSVYIVSWPSLRYRLLHTFNHPIQIRSSNILSRGVNRWISSSGILHNWHCILVVGFTRNSFIFTKFTTLTDSESVYALGNLAQPKNWPLWYRGNKTCISECTRSQWAHGFSCIAIVYIEFRRPEQNISDEQWYITPPKLRFFPEDDWGSPSPRGHQFICIPTQEADYDIYRSDGRPFN